MSSYVKDDSFKVKSVYGKGNKHRDYFSLLFLLFFAAVIFILMFSNLLFPTGRVTMQVSESVAGEALDGTLKLGLREGELIPAGSIVNVSLNKQSYQSQLFSLLQGRYEQKTGEYYAENVNLSGEGAGYGFEGYLGKAERVYFKLRLVREAGGGQDKNKSEEKKEERNETEDLEKNESESVEQPVMQENETVPVAEEPIEQTDVQDEQEQQEEVVEVVQEEVVSDIEIGEDSESLITGFAVHEKERVIEGNVIRGEVFEIREPNWDSVEIIEVKNEAGDVIDFNNINVVYENKTVRVTTEYVTGEKGFGEKYLTGNEHEIEIGINSFNLKAEDGELRIELRYGDEEIVRLTKQIEIKEPEDNITEPVRSKKNIPDFVAKRNENISINLSEFFSGAVDYKLSEGFRARGLSLMFEDNVLTIVPDENYTGINILRIDGVGDAYRVSSNMFSVLITDANINSEDKQDRGEIGKPVRWVRHISLDRQENFTIRLPDYAENMSVKSFSDGINVSLDILSEETLQRSLLTGMVTDTGLETSNGFFTKVFLFLKQGFSKGITGNVVLMTAEEQGQLIYINESASEFFIEYYTAPPSVSERSISEAKKIVSVFASDELNYTDIVTYTDIPETKRVGEEDFINVYWIEGGRRVPSRAYDSDNDSLLDRVEWLTPHLSNQSFEVSLTVITIKSYPMVGNNWTIEFNTTGTADLYVAASNGTTWTNYSENETLYDLKFLEVRCGNESMDYEWVDNNCSRSGNCTAVVRDYYCESIGVVISKVLTEGKHTIRFMFGNDTDYAYNTAISACGTLNANSQYELTAHVTDTDTCFSVGGANVILDCQGNAINYSTQTMGNAVYSSGYNNITVKNCIIRLNNSRYGEVNDSDAIHIRSGNNMRVQNNTIWTVGVVSGSVNNTGIRFVTVDDSYIQNNTVETRCRGCSAVLLYSGCDRNNVWNNNVSIYNQSSNGLTLDTNNDYNWLDNNTIWIGRGTNTQYNYGVSIYYLSDYNNVTNTTVITNCSASWCGGLLAYYSVDNNVFDTAKLLAYGPERFYGIWDYGGTSLTYTNNNNVFRRINVTAMRNAPYSWSPFSLAATTYRIDNSTVYDSVLVDNGYDPYVYSVRAEYGASGYFANMSFVNVSMNKSDFSFATADYDPQFYFKYYLDVQVNNSVGAPLGNANISVYNASNNLVFSKLTSASGFARIEVLESLKNRTGFYFTGPHNVNITLASYAENFTTFNFTARENVYHKVTLSSGCDPDDTPSAVTCCGNMNSASTTYTLTSDVSSTGTCFVVAADGITIDGNGRSINYSTDGASISVLENGVFVNDSDNVVVKNLIVRNGDDSGAQSAIYVNNSMRASVINNTINLIGDSTYRGVFVESNSDYVNVSDNRIYNALYAVQVYSGADYVNVSNNFINGTYFSILLQGSYGKAMNCSGYGSVSFSGGYNNMVNVNFRKDSSIAYYTLYMEGSDNLIRDSKLSSSIANAGGVFIVDTSCTNCSLINSNVTVFGSNAYGLYIGTEQPSELSGNLSIIDSVIRSVNSYDYAFVAGLGATNHINVNATNVSSDYETYWVYGMEDSARLFMNYNIDSYINITNGTNAVGATFTGRDKNNNLIFSDTTNASGNAARKTVISMIKSITQNTTFSLYNMTASLAGAVSVSNTTVNVTRNLMINLQIDRGANFTDCATNKCIFIKNKAGDNKAAFDSLGNVDLEGNVYMNGAGTATGNDFLIKNKAGTTKAWVDNVNGTLMIAGGVTQKQGTYCTPPANSWIVRSKAGNCVAYIDTSGNLWLRGTLGTASPI